MDKFNKVLIGDFVGEYNSYMRLYAVLVIGKDEENQELIVDDVYCYRRGKGFRIKKLELDDWEFFDKHSQNQLHKELVKISLENLPEKLKYLRLIKLIKIQKNIQNNLID